ncbi:MAG: hypothetical protein ACE5GO_01395 [Anaerolineales bacterium]
MTRELLLTWGLGFRDAERLARSWEEKGWLAKDPKRGNARFVTDTLKKVLESGQS